MEIMFAGDAGSSKIIYGETLAASLPHLPYQNKHLLIVTNQRYYDLFSQKINQLLQESADIDWYICPNQRNCNTLAELTSILNFISNFIHTDFVFIAFGNEGVVELTNYLQKNSLLKSDFWVLPVSLRSLGKALVSEALIIDNHQQPLLHSYNLPQLILFDQTLTQEQSTGKLLDLLLFIKCGLLLDRQFLKELFFNYPDQKSVANKPLSGMLVNLIHYYQKAGAEIDNYGSVFKRAFYQIEAGHYLSDSMKDFFGILFQLLWTVEKKELNFNYYNFLLWLRQIGYPLELPANFFISDYVQAVMNLLAKSESLLSLAKIGTIDGTEMPASQELITMLESYQKYLDKFR